MFEFNILPHLLVFAAFLSAIVSKNKNRNTKFSLQSYRSIYLLFMQVENISFAILKFGMRSLKSGIYSGMHHKIPGTAFIQSNQMKNNNSKYKCAGYYFNFPFTCMNYVNNIENIFFFFFTIFIYPCYLLHCSLKSASYTVKIYTTICAGGKY